MDYATDQEDRADNLERRVGQLQHALGLWQEEAVDSESQLGFAVDAFQEVTSETRREHYGNEETERRIEQERKRDRRGGDAMNTTTAQDGAVPVAAFDAADYLEDDEMMAEYLSAALEDPNPDVFLMAVRDVARARGMARLAIDAGMGAREPVQGPAPRCQAAIRDSRQAGPGAGRAAARRSGGEGAGRPIMNPKHRIVTATPGCRKNGATASGTVTPARKSRRSGQRFAGDIDTGRPDDRTLAYGLVA
jgi:hypothetical protein